MVAAGPCPLCHQGQVGFRLCSPAGLMVLLCSGCGFVWMHPAEIGPESAHDPLDPAFARRYPDCNLRSSRWASEEEVKAQGWGVYLLRPEDLGKA
jgi:hypothetical protein